MRLYLLFRDIPSCCGLISLANPTSQIVRHIGQKEQQQQQKSGISTVSMLVSFMRVYFYDLITPRTLPPKNTLLVTGLSNYEFYQATKFRQTYIHTWSMIGSFGYPNPLYYQMDMRGQISCPVSVSSNLLLVTEEWKTWWKSVGKFSWCEEQLKV